MKPYYVTITYLIWCECWIVFIAVHNGRKWLHVVTFCDTSTACLV